MPIWISILLLTTSCHERSFQNTEVSIGKALFFDDKVCMLGSTHCTVCIHRVVVTDCVVLFTHCLNCFSTQFSKYKLTLKIFDISKVSSEY